MVVSSHCYTETGRAECIKMKNTRAVLSKRSQVIVMQVCDNAGILARAPLKHAYWLIIIKKFNSILLFI